jgi:hypothetical protein
VAPNFTLDSVADSDYRGKCDVGGFLIFEWTLVNNLKNKVLSLVFFFGFWNGTIDIVCPFQLMFYFVFTINSLQNLNGCYFPYSNFYVVRLVTLNCLELLDNKTNIQT